MKDIEIDQVAHRASIDGDTDTECVCDDMLAGLTNISLVEELVDDGRVFELQAYAVRHNDAKLLHLTYAALGVDRRVAFEPVTDAERIAARRGCANEIEMIRLMGGML